MQKRIALVTAVARVAAAWECCMGDGGSGSNSMSEYCMGDGYGDDDGEGYGDGYGGSGDSGDGGDGGDGGSSS